MQRILLTALTTTALGAHGTNVQPQQFLTKDSMNQFSNGVLAIQDAFVSTTTMSNVTCDSALEAAYEAAFKPVEDAKKPLDGAKRDLEEWQEEDEDA